MSQQDKFDIDSGGVIAGLSSGMLTSCFKENDNYLKCKTDNANPQNCLRESIEVRKCAFSLAEKYMSEGGCPSEFVSYVKCLRTREFEFKDCYKMRTLFENCAKTNLGIKFREPINPKKF
eukprot:gene12388-6055_t